MTKIRAAAPRIATRAPRFAKPPKARARVYGTPEHRLWAAEVVRRADGVCQGQRCQNPFAPGRRFADHVTELKDGGDFSLTNGVALCGSCHGLKTLSERARRMGSR